MLSTYLQQCCLLIVPDEQSETASFTAIHNATAGLRVSKKVYTSSPITCEAWKIKDYSTELMAEANLLEIWLKAFNSAFEDGFRKVILLNDAPKGLYQQHLEEAFLSLRILEVCMGPRKDGGLYLAGMHTYIPEILNNSALNENPTWKNYQKAVGAQKLAMYKLPAF